MGNKDQKKTQKKTQTQTQKGILPKKDNDKKKQSNSYVDSEYKKWNNGNGYLSPANNDPDDDPFNWI